MSSLEALQKFFGSKALGSLPPDNPFARIDRDQWVKKNSLKERAAEQGALNQPPSDAKTFDAVENEILSAIASELNSAQILANNQFASYESRLAGLRLLSNLSSIRAGTEEASGDFASIVKDYSNALELTRRNVTDAFLDLKEFKKRRNITAPANPPPSKRLTWGIIASFGVAEIIANGVFLGVNDDLGLLGGGLLALVIAAINIAVAAATGRFALPLKNERDIIKKYFGYACITAWIVFVGSWNLLAGHLRDAKYEGLSNYELAAYNKFLTEPFPLASISSWGIFILGCICAIVVLLDAYKMDDPIPGYGPKSRNFAYQCDSYGQLVAQAYEKLRQIRNEAIDKATGVKRELENQIRERDLIAKSYDRFTKRLEQHCAYLEQEANYFLSIYRTENRKARTIKEPAHFQERFQIQKIATQKIDLPDVTKKDIKDTGIALDKCIEVLGAEFEASIGEFVELKDLMREIEEMAHE